MIYSEEEKLSMSLLGHLSELRRRLVIVAIALILGSLLSVYFAKFIYAWLQAPLLTSLGFKSSFIALTPLEGWIVYLKVGILAAIFLTSPIWFYQLWAFISPGLYTRERKYIVAVVFLSSILFIGGALFFYYLVAPYAFQYFASLMQDTDIVLMPSMSLYLSFMLRILLAFGLIFEAPLVVLTLIKLRIVSLYGMKKARPFVIVLAFVLAAIITPPDVLTQVMLAIPLILLFEASLGIARLLTRKRGNDE